MPRTAARPGSTCPRRRHLEGDEESVGHARSLCQRTVTAVRRRGTAMPPMALRIVRLGEPRGQGEDCASARCAARREVCPRASSLRGTSTTPAPRARAEPGAGHTGAARGDRPRVVGVRSRLPQGDVDPQARHLLELVSAFSPDEHRRRLLLRGRGPLPPLGAARAARRARRRRPDTQRYAACARSAHACVRVRTGGGRRWRGWHRARNATCPAGSRRRSR